MRVYIAYVKDAQRNKITFYNELRKHPPKPPFKLEIFPRGIKILI